MEHVAILKKSIKLLPKILSGEKTIESRWYVARFAPYGRIKPGEIVYFKNSGEPVSAKATVDRVLQESDLNRIKVSRLLKDYGERIGFPKSEWDQWSRELGRKNYAVLVFLRNPEKVRPFQIDKTGFGNMVAWISVEHVASIRRLLPRS